MKKIGNAPYTDKRHCGEVTRMDKKLPTESPNVTNTTPERSKQESPRVSK